MWSISKNTRSVIRTVTQHGESGSHKHVPIPEALAISNVFDRRGLWFGGRQPIFEISPVSLTFPHRIWDLSSEDGE